jgi:hypothetical protein
MIGQNTVLKLKELAHSMSFRVVVS